MPLRVVSMHFVARLTEAKGEPPHACEEIHGERLDHPRHICPS